MAGSPAHARDGLETPESPEFPLQDEEEVVRRRDASPTRDKTREGDSEQDSDGYLDSGGVPLIKGV